MGGDQMKPVGDGFPGVDNVGPTFKEEEHIMWCDLCGSRSLQPLFKHANKERCSACGFVFVSPRPTPHEIAGSCSARNFYDAWLQEETERRKLWEKRYARIVRKLPPHCTILDYGAGLGTFLDLARADKHHVYGAEISASAREYTLKRFGIALGNETGLLGPKFTEFFDIVTAWHVLEHVGSPSALLRGFHMVLKKGGTLIVAVPNNEYRPFKNLVLGRPSEFSRLYRRLRPGLEIHLSYFVSETLKRMVAKAGFVVDEVSIDDHYVSRRLRTRVKYYM